MGVRRVKIFSRKGEKRCLQRNGVGDKFRVNFVCLERRDSGKRRGAERNRPSRGLLNCNF